MTYQSGGGVGWRFTRLLPGCVSTERTPSNDAATHRCTGPPNRGRPTTDCMCRRSVTGMKARAPTFAGDVYEEREGKVSAQVDPSHIMQVGMGFWGSKTLLSAVELELFTKLGSEPMAGPEIAEALSLHPRAIPDLPDALVALGLLDREGEGSDALYRNTEDGAVFLDKASPAYIGGILEMANARLYGFWGDLTEALQTGKPQNEIKHTGRPMFEELYSDPARLEQFMRAMQGISLGNFHALAEKFDFSRYETLCDVGGATGQLCTILAEHHPHLRCTSYDLAVVV